MTDTGWPQPLESAIGPFSPTRVDGAAEGMGQYGPATRTIAAAGLVPPDLLTGMTLFLLANQPPARSSETGGHSRQTRQKASPIDGGVWVREQLTIHRPLPRTDAFVVSGESTGRYVHKGRRYGTTNSQSHDSGGHLFATNLTTGLLSYQVDERRADMVEGLPIDQNPAPRPDWSVAPANPHLDLLRSAAVGDGFYSDTVTVTLAMMAARDTSAPDNPIHSDPDAAKAAGLPQPIVGGSHLLSFALEPLLAAWGNECLFHGAHIDARWKAPTPAESCIVASTTVVAKTDSELRVDLDVQLADGPTAMVAEIRIPLAQPTNTRHD